MRGRVDGLPIVHPLVDSLPEIYRRRRFTAHVMAVFDDALAPVFVVLDNIEAYFDPRLTPTDFVNWLGGWFGLSPDGTWVLERRRARIGRAVELFTTLGTVAGMTTYIAIYFDVDDGAVEIEENGGVVASTTAGATIPGRLTSEVLVRLTLADPRPDDADRLDAIVAAIKPAHIAHRVEVVPA